VVQVIRRSGNEVSVADHPRGHAPATHRPPTDRFLPDQRIRRQDRPGPLPASPRRGQACPLAARALQATQERPQHARGAHRGGRTFAHSPTAWGAGCSSGKRSINSGPNAVVGSVQPTRACRSGISARSTRSQRIRATTECRGRGSGTNRCRKASPSPTRLQALSGRGQRNALRGGDRRQSSGCSDLRAYP
jgi:hypothetical protein